MQSGPLSSQSTNSGGVNDSHSEDSCDEYPKITFRPTAKEMAMLCLICQDYMGPGVQDMISLPCGHVFHEPCNKNWRQRSTTCPACRTPCSRPTTAVKLFFEVTDVTMPENLVLANVVENLEFKLKMEKKKGSKLDNLLELEKRKTNHLLLEVRRKQVSINEIESLYEEQKRFVRVKTGEVTEAQLQRDFYQNELRAYESFHTLLCGLQSEAEEECQKGVLGPEQLTLCLLAYKKDLNASMKKMSDMTKAYNKLKTEMDMLKAGKTVNHIASTSGPIASTSSASTSSNLFSPTSSTQAELIESIQINAAIAKSSRAFQETHNAIKRKMEGGNTSSGCSYKKQIKPEVIEINSDDDIEILPNPTTKEKLYGPRRGLTSTRPLSPRSKVLVGAAAKDCYLWNEMPSLSTQCWSRTAVPKIQPLIQPKLKVLPSGNAKTNLCLAFIDDNVLKRSNFWEERAPKRAIDTPAEESEEPLIDCDLLTPKLQKCKILTTKPHSSTCQLIPVHIVHPPKDPLAPDEEY